MATAYPSIQTFCRREAPVEKSSPQQNPIKQGDGFTEEELSDALDPLSRKWNPEQEYDERTIAQLVPGPNPVTFAGRIVNISTVLGQSQKQTKAAGWHYLILKDDTAAVSIKLYFAHSQYPLKLGQLLSIWTVFISDSAKAGTIAINNVNVYANLFPGRVTSDHVMAHTTDSTIAICRSPLEYRKRQPLQGLMTLDSYLSSGHDDVLGVKLLVCVKSIGAKRRIRTKKGMEFDVAEVLLFDHTGEIRLGLWNEIIESAKDWRAGKTILLISNPEYRPGFSAKGTVNIAHSSMVEVDPEFSDADWLKKYAAGLTKKESLVLEFPEGVWDVEAAEYGVNRMLFTLAELDNWVRSDSQQVFSGFINVVIMEMSLVSLHRRNMLMCAECCGVPIFSNTLKTPCRNCSKPLSLTLNPRVIGTLVDETGCITQGKMLWSNRAWEHVFGRSIGEICEMSAEDIMLIEERLIFMRLHLVVGWSEGVGRLAVLGIMS